MSPASVSFTAWLAVGLSAAWAQEAPQPRMNARELFYNTAAGSPAAKPKPAEVAKAAAPARKKSAPPPAQLATAQPAPAPPAAPPASAPAAAPGGQIVRVSTSDNPPVGAPAAPALGLKYTVMKLTDGKMADVSAKTVFHAGDRIRFSVEPNGPGYLYIVTQGSSGTWRPVFPSPEIADGNNQVQAWQTYDLPPKSRMVFDQQPGTERIFMVLSRTPLPDLEQLMYSLKSGSKPASMPAAPLAMPKTLVADLSIDDGTVGRLRQVYSRDLIIENVGDHEDTAPAAAREKAVYVVNPTGSPDSRLVADIQLVHQ